MLLPVSEVFCSPQGEGVYAGTLMTFVRFAGCTVGTRYPQECYKEIDTPPLFPIYTNECHLYDGRTFPCDTDYGMKMRREPHQILDLVQKENPLCMRVCITGGEPLMHDLRPFIALLKGTGYRVHIETSGTVPLTKEHVIGCITECNHVAVSPKLKFIPQYVKYADEIKLLVDDNFSIDKLPKSIRENFNNKIFLQPVNGEHDVNLRNLELCLLLQKSHPQVRISTQAHKFWGVR